MADNPQRFKGSLWESQFSHILVILTIGLCVILGSYLEKACCEKEFEIEPSKSNAFQSWDVWKIGMNCCSFCDLIHRDLRIV